MMMCTKSPSQTWAKECLKKVIDPKDLEKFVLQLKNEEKTITTLNGSFDLLHAGHLQIIYEASQLGDILIVALNSDSSIKKYKSPKRPIIPLKYRLEMVSALQFVNFVTWFDELDPIEFLKKVKPNWHVNGVEYGENCIEADVVKQFGGKLHLVKKIEGLSTSQIIEKIKCEI